MRRAIPEHDAEKCKRFSDDIMLLFFDVYADSDFRPIRRKIIRIWRRLLERLDFAGSLLECGFRILT